MKKAKKKKASKKSNADLLDSNSESNLAQLIADIDTDLKNAHHHTQDTAQFDEAKTQDRVELGRHICVELGGRQLAIPLTSVLETGRDLPVQPLPLLPEWIIGIANIRGEIVSMVNLNLFFDLKNSSSDQEQMQSESKPYIIVHNKNLKIAVTVDKILITRSLFSIKTENLKQIEKKDMLSKHFSGHAFYEEKNTNAQKEVFLFDLDKLLSSNHLHDFSTT